MQHICSLFFSFVEAQCGLTHVWEPSWFFFHWRSAASCPGRPTDASVEQEVFPISNLWRTPIKSGPQVQYNTSLHGQTDWGGYKRAEQRVRVHLQADTMMRTLALLLLQVAYGEWCSRCQASNKALNLFQLLCVVVVVVVVFGCGTPAVKPDTNRVVNGEDARPHSWPWQVL